MKRLVSMMAFTLLSASVMAQTHAGDSVMLHAKGNRLSVGGYGEVGYTREFFSDHVNRYSSPANYKNDPSHGKFDIPHAVIYLGYDFGKGWTMGTEIEFEQQAITGQAAIRLPSRWLTGFSMISRIIPSMSTATAKPLTENGILWITKPSAKTDLKPTRP